MVERIKGLCKNNKISIKALEKELGIGNGSIAKWTKSKPSVENILKISQKFDVSLDWLVTGKEPEELTQEERNLVNLYRAAEERGKRAIIRTAEAENLEQESLDSKIG